MCCGAGVDIESGIGRVLTFEDKIARQKFIRNVYLILSAQLIATFVMVIVCVNSDSFYDYVETHPLLLVAAVVTVFGTLIALTCCGDLRRNPPFNYIFLGLFTLAEAFLASALAAKYDPHIVLMAVGLTAIICVSLTLFAMQTKYDFTVLTAFLFIASVVLLLIGIVTIFYRSFLLTMIYCSFGVLLFSLFLIVDTQMIMGGDRQVIIGPSEHVFAALTLYVDIISIFMFLLRIIGDNF